MQVDKSGLKTGDVITIEGRYEVNPIVNELEPPPVKDGDLITFEGSPRKFRAANCHGTPDGIQMFSLEPLDDSK